MSALANDFQVKNLNKASFLDRVFDFEKEQEWVFKGKVPAIIDFYADWCGPCKMLAPIYEKLAREYGPSCDFYKIDGEAEMELSAAFGIRGFPSLLFIPLEGKPAMNVGFLDEEKLRRAIVDILGLPESSPSAGS